MNDLLLEILAHYNLSEITGKNNNPDIIAFFDEFGYNIDDDSTTSWCSAMLSYYAKKCGYEYNHDLSARNWLKMPIVV